MTSNAPRRTAIAVLAAATALGFAATGHASSGSPAATLQANDLCYGAGVTGTITGTRGSEFCTTTGLGTLCSTPGTGLYPTLGVWAEACVPVPF